MKVVRFGCLVFSIVKNIGGQQSKTMQELNLGMEKQNMILHLDSLIALFWWIFFKIGSKGEASKVYSSKGAYF